MALATTHLKVSAISDTGDGTLVQPSDWNAAHVLTGIASAAQGGTGFDTYAVGDLLYASAAGALSKLADVAVGSVLVSGGVGVAPAWSAAPTLTSLAVTDDAYGAGWNGVLTVPTKNAVYDKFESLFSGHLFLGGNLYVGGGAGNGVIFAGGSRTKILDTGIDAALNFTDAATGTIGVGLDFATDTILKVRTRAQTGYATVDCLGLKASGAAGANFGPAAPASITIVNGIVTACS